MTSRILPVGEWEKLAHLDMWPLIMKLDPDTTTVFIVEDGSRIIGAWFLVTIAHVEGLWIAPEHRKRGRVLLRLWNQLLDIARGRGIGTVWTGSVTDEVTALLQARGACRLPEMYALPLREARS